MIPRAAFGRTGHQSSRVVFGAAALARMSQERADPLLDLLDRFGVNHLDTAASYGRSELRLAPWLATRRADFFLATKTDERTGDGARASLERSLERLGVDHVDLIQLHNLVEPDEWDTAHGPGGAVEALVQAREEGLTRFIGVTGHGLRIAGMHRASLERFDFDSVLLPYNWILLTDPGYRTEVEALLEVARERQVAVQTIKSLARRRWTEVERPPDPAPPRHSWYEPLADPEAAARSIRWVLGQPDLFLNTSSDADLLAHTLATADALADQPVPTEAEMAADVADQEIQPLFDGDRLERI
jgi:aryl-alcohol dehydrogenase-like predicted oxidoreductase